MKKIDKSANEIFFTSDTHFGHNWIIKFNNRPFATEEEMDKALIENWNRIVPANGLTFILGDIGFTDDSRIINIFSQLNGEKILIRGNHDGNYKEETLKSIFIEIHDLLYVRIFDDISSKFCYMMLCHYPMLDWKSSFRGAWQLFDHVHTRELEEFKTFKTNLFALQYDVGADNNNYRPISFYEVKEIIENQKKDKSFKQSNYY